MCLQRKPICFLGDGEETLRARFPPSLNPGFPAQTQWSSSTVQTIKHKGKQHRDSKQVQPEWCSTQHVAICHDPLSLSLSSILVGPRVQATGGKRNTLKSTPENSEKKVLCQQNPRSKQLLGNPSNPPHNASHNNVLRVQSSSWTIKQGTGNVMFLHDWVIQNSKVPAMSLPGLHCVI